MKKRVMILIALAFIAGSCGQNNTKKHHVSDIENAAKPQSILLDINKMKNKSFVVSCGSGCAMRYTAENIAQNGTSIDVKFIVEMYINEILEETDYVNYTFIYNEEYELQKTIG